MKSSNLKQPIPMSAPIAYAGIKNNIPEAATGTELASIATGFPDITMKALKDGGLPPRGQDCNGMFYLSTDMKVYQQNGGIITFNQTVSDLIGGYPKNAILDYIDSGDKYHKVQSLIDDNTYNFLTNPEYIDDEHWQEIKFGGGSGGSSLPLFTPMLFDHVLEGDEAVGWALQGSLVTNTYPAAVNAIKTAYTSGTNETFTLGDITFPYKKAQNGWQIADIAQKDNVDALFTQTGVAKFYVLDSANNQFYLPRENWFQQLTTDPDKVNQYNEAGLPNIEGILSSEWPIFTSAKGALKIINTASPYKIAEASSGSGKSQFGIDASRSSSIYGNSDTVQPPSSNWFLYYVVGNTITNESEIDVGNVLSDLQLKADTDLANVTAAAQNFKDMSVGWGIPDYASGVTIPSGYTAPTDGWIYAISSANSNDNYSLLYVDEIKVGNAQGGSTIQDPVSLYALVGKGSTVTFTRCTTTFYPMKGVSQNA